MKTVVGIVGQSVSGKGTVAKVLEEEFGFFATSLSDRIREELERRGIVETRDLMNQVGNELRGEFGADILVKRTQELIEGENLGKVVIESVRNPEEVNFIKREMGGVIIGVEASEKMRFELMKKRGRNGDASTWEEFMRLEKAENNEGEEGHVQKVSECLKMADYTIDNNGTREELVEKVREMAKELKLDF